MSRIITPRTKNHYPMFSLCFADPKVPGAGWSFNCDKDGNVFPESLNNASRRHLADCLSGANGVIPEGVKDYSYDYTDDAILKCDCGREVTLILRAYYNECECGRLYNLSGQELAPKSQWDPRGEY